MAYGSLKEEILMIVHLTQWKVGRPIKRVGEGEKRCRI
jgi:hypothetical protein